MQYLQNLYIVAKLNTKQLKIFYDCNRAAATPGGCFIKYSGFFFPLKYKRACNKATELKHSERTFAFIGLKLSIIK